MGGSSGRARILSAGSRRVRVYNDGLWVFLHAPHEEPRRDVTDDGRRFLVNTLPAIQSNSPLTLVQNWTRLAERR